jgi:ribosomal protein L32
MRFESSLVSLGICRYAFIVTVVLMVATAWTFARADDASNSAASSRTAAAAVQQDSQKLPDQDCPQCGKKVSPGKGCKNCGRVFRGSTGGADPTSGIRNRVKSDVSKIGQTNRNINQSLRSLNNNLRNLKQNIFRIRDINRRL